MSSTVPRALQYCSASCLQVFPKASASYPFICSVFKHQSTSSVSPVYIAYMSGVSPPLVRRLISSHRSWTSLWLLTRCSESSLITFMRFFRTHKWIIFCPVRVTESSLAPNYNNILTALLSSGPSTAAYRIRGYWSTIVSTLKPCFRI